MYLKLANEFSNVHINVVPFNGGSDRKSTKPLSFPVMRFLIVHIVFILSVVKTLANDLVCLLDNKKSPRNVSNWICLMLLSTYRKKFEKELKV